MELMRYTALAGWTCTVELFLAHISTATRCPEDFPVCHADGDCVIAACTRTCEWQREVNYIDGFDGSGAKCARDSQPRPFQDIDGSCTRIPTAVSWIPTWLHVRTRLAVAIWGTVPFTRSEVIAFAPLAARRAPPVCLLGEISVRLALELRKLDDIDIGHDPRAGNLYDHVIDREDVINHTMIASDWAFIRRLGFKHVIQSGWPVFELLRRIQYHVLRKDERRTQHDDDPWDSRCDVFTRPNDWKWLDAFPRDNSLLPFEGMKQLPDYELNKATKDAKRHETKVCHLAYATHYLIIAANVFRRPGIKPALMYDDNLIKLPHPQAPGVWTDVFLYHCARYMRTIKSILFSWWPILSILGQLSATANLYDPEYSYVKPFITGLAGPEDEDHLSPALVEAGAHDGSDAMVFAELFPNVDIWAFEANPTVYATLETEVKNCGKACQRIHTTEAALGAGDQETVPFFINMPANESSKSHDSLRSWGTDSSSSLYRPLTNMSRFSQYQSDPIDVPATSLAKFFAATAGMGKVRFMDLDAEGGELNILLGASASMLQGVYAMKLEIRDDSPLLQGVPLFPEVVDWLLPRGFVLVIRSGSDALFVRRDLALL